MAVSDSLETSMVWALLAKFLTSKPPLVQALVVGLSSGLFVATAAEANERNPLITSTVLLVLVAGAVLGGLFYAGLAVQRRNAWTHDEPGPGWLYALYAGVWILGLAAAAYALLSEGGFKVAALAIVPLVLLAPTAFEGIRRALRRVSA
jgi:hypothetical protein